MDLHVRRPRCRLRDRTGPHPRTSPIAPSARLLGQWRPTSLILFLTVEPRMDKIWLKNYPAGVPHDVQPEQYRSAAHLLEEAMRKHAANPFSVCMDRWMSYAELDRQSQRWAPGCRPGAGTRRARGHHAAQHSAVRRDHGGRAARGLHLREREPAVHRTRAGAPAQGLGRHRHRHPGELCPHAGRGDRAHRRAACGDGLHGRPAGLLVRPLDHLCRAPPGQDGAGLRAAADRRAQGGTFKKALALGARRTLQPSQATSIPPPSCSTPAAPRACRKARC
jgi:long-chain acyl-CoA synthetase